MSQHPPRAFGFWTATFVVAASMVGSGILTSSGKTLLATESPGTLFVTYIVGGIMALCGALAVAELGASIPHAGGDYVFVRHAFGNPTAFVFGWCCLLFTFAGPIALISRLTVSYIAGDALQADGVLARSLASLIVVIFTVVHCIGQRQSGWIQNATTITKLAIFLIFAVVGFLSQKGSFAHFSEGAGIGEKGGWSLFAQQLTYALYAYSGWNGAAYLAGEIRNPERNLPRSLIAGSLLVTTLYLLMNAVYIYALPIEAIRSAKEAQVERIAWLAGERLFGEGISRILSMIFGIGMIATVSALLFTGPRIGFMMARDGLLPKPFAWLHPTRHAPSVATMLLGGISIVMIWPESFGQILDFTALGLTTLSGLTVASLFPLRARPDWPARFKTPFYPIPPVLFLVLTAFTVVLSVIQDPVIGMASIGSIFIGYPLFAIYAAFARDRLSPPNTVEALLSSRPDPGIVGDATS